MENPSLLEFSQYTHKPLGKRVCTKKQHTSDKGDIPMRELHINYFIPYAIENTATNKVRVTNTQHMVGKLDVILLNISAFL